MDFSVKKGSPESQKTACLILGAFEKKKLTPAAEAIDRATDGAITALLKGGDLKGKPGQTLWMHAPAGVAAERLLLVGCGDKTTLDDATYRKVIQGASTALRPSAAKDALCCLQDLEVKGRDLAWKVQQITEAVGNAVYLFDQMKSEKDKDAVPSLKKFHFLEEEKEAIRAAEVGSKRGAAVVLGVALAKDLANLPGNVCTPTYLAQQAKKLGETYKSLQVSVLEEKDMEKLGMGALLSVSRGSRQPAKLITMEYQGGKKGDKPVVLVGKGLTFDAGGISLKPAAAMDEMKYDMCGAAGVFGTMQALAELKLPINVVGVVPSSENLPDGAANKPGDIVTSMSGQTIEILNTDAEGRLILCDALTYSKKFDPAQVIDVATLTGACVIALGKQATGLLGNDDELIDELLAAGQNSGDRAWQLPLWEEYQEQLKSPFADMANIGGREAGTVTAACFLSRYTKEYKWAHLDIAGTAWNSGADKGATGRPVPLLVQYLLSRTAK
ncbi:leucyl aminopeptidase [Thiohalomonas denitrificans]|uniref:Probable cytosol aminopeptidase n=1 Tax=Thiohalomonas denitrificans TaxID=415747 RepID=A0A1G5PZ51_9GAMM|nr:leucyl aminopeptidase [Thiohalomonas denitrificans]SCZ54451.1 aminopeptidase A. Metallo peptidase. MEROPS family M17 [Thiohalomonas denitrificans]